jgi:hypothetical protein
MNALPKQAGPPVPRYFADIGAPQLELQALQHVARGDVVSPGGAANPDQ